MLYTTQPLYCIVATVMVRQHQPLRRNYLARTATVEANDGILERGAIGVIDVVFLELESSFHEGWVLSS